MPPNLVSQWLETLHLRGEDAQAGLDRIGSSLGRYYELNRLLQWRRGERTIPEDVQVLMRRECIADAIRAEGGTPPTTLAARQRLAQRLEPLKRSRR